MEQRTGIEQIKPKHPGQFKKGGPSPNPAGRPKGKLSKKNELLDEFMTKIVAIGSDRFIQQLMKLEGKAYTDVYLTAYEFVRGKIARTELAVTPGEDKKKQYMMFGETKIEF